MSQLLRQIGVVVGLTVILTFPVTVVSGAGSQKQPDHVPRVLAVTGWKGQVHRAVVMPGARNQGNQKDGRCELRQ